MSSNTYLWFIICWLAVISAQELAHFDVTSKVDFSKDNVLADLPPPSSKASPTSTDKRGLSKSPVAKSTSYPDAAVTTKKEHISNSEEVPKFAPVVSYEDSSPKETTQSKEDVTATNKVWSGVLFDPKNDEMEETPPKIRYPSTQQRIIVKQNHKKGLTVQCSASGYPAAKYTWLKDGSILGNTDKYIKAFDNGTLFFEDFNNRENGLYQCFAENMYGTSVSVKVPILDGEIRKTGSTVDNITITATEGQAVVFPCSGIPSDFPEYTTKWLISTGSTQLHMSDRIGTDSQGSLRFAYVLHNDTRSYICSLAPDVAAPGDTVPLYNSVTLTVKKGTLYEAPPKLEYVSSNVKATINSKAVLECFFSGFPTATITWKNRSNQLIAQGDPRFSIEDFGRKVIITKVTEDDAGIFTCTAANRHGQGDKAGTIRVNVTGPPQPVPFQGLDTQTVVEGTDAVLKCKATAVAKQQLEAPVWYRNGEPFSDSFSTRYSFNSDMTELQIRNATKPDDTACFQCNISNSEGYLFYDGYLRVIDSIKIVKKPPNYIFIDKNSTVDISVKASGDKCCKLDELYSFEGVALSKTDLQTPPFRYGDDGTLLFDASSADNETIHSRVGNYMCRVSNRYQNVYINFTILWNGTQIEEATPIPEQLVSTKAGMELWWIGVLCGILVIIIAIIVIVVFIKSNYPRDTYPLEKAEIKHHLDPEQDLLNQSFQEI